MKKKKKSNDFIAISILSGIKSNISIERDLLMKFFVKKKKYK